MFAITFFEGMFQLVEGLVLGIEKGSIPSEKVVVDHLGQRHAAYPRVRTMICAAYPLEPMPRSRPEPLSAAQIAGLLAEDDRLRVVAALALGASTEEAVVKGTGIESRRLRLALERLAGGGLVVVDADGGLRLVAEQFKQAAREAAEAKRRDQVQPEDLGATAEQAEVLRHFMEDGRLTSIPTQKTKRRVVLDFLAARFEPGKVYPERDVNFLLGKFHRDYAALRRYLVDEEFLERRGGFYWRSGGTFEVDS